MHAAHQQACLRQNAAVVHLSGDTVSRQVAGRDALPHVIQRRAARSHTDQLLRIADGVQRASRVQKQRSIGEPERIAAAAQGGISHFIVVKGQQAHAARRRQHHLIPLLLQQADRPRLRVKDRRTADAAVG